MTDVELVKEYVCNHVHYEVVKREDGTEYASQVSNVTTGQAFLDGLKAGSQLDEVWHDYDAGEDCYEDSHEGRWVKREAAKSASTESMLKELLDRGVIRSWYYNGSYHVGSELPK